MEKNSDIVMPSMFASLQSIESHPLVSKEELKRLITQDFQLESLTTSYRKRLEISKKFADEVKPMSPAICAALQYDGHGRTMEHIAKEVGMLSLDYDDIPTNEMEEVFKRATNTNLSHVVYRTIGGHGIRIFVLYERTTGCTLTIVELFDLMLRKAMNFYNTLLGYEADTQCTDIGRLSGLAHDKDAYFNWESESMKLSPNELKVAYQQQKLPTANKGGRPKGSKTSNTTNRTKWSNRIPSMEEAEPQIMQMLTSWDRSFESTRHNEYVTSFGYICLKYGIDEKEASDYAISHFSQDYPNTAHVMRSIYKHTNKKGIWHFFRHGETTPQHATVKLIRQWLETHYSFHHNTVTGKYEVMSRLTQDMKYPRWTFLDDSVSNSIWMEMDMDGIHTTVAKMISIICSDFSEPYDPFESYLRSLPAWDGATDYIQELAARITVEERKGYYHSQKDFEEYFKKWFTAMVVAWVSPSVVNQTMPVFIGRGGLFKTTFMNYLLPPQLRDYYVNDSTANYLDKDFMEAFASKGLICLDEFDAVYGRNLSAFKSNMTKLKFSVRLPYDKFRSELLHHSSVSGTSNVQHVITDVENRRFSPWLIKKIISPLEKPFNYEGIYSQALALGQSVSKGKRRADGWVYWTTDDDIEKMRSHNRLFMVANYAEEQILRYYRIPDESTELSCTKFLTNAEILDKIATNPVLRQNLSNQSIGSVMARLGFKSIHRRTGNCWHVVEKEGFDIANYSRYDPTEIVND